MTTSDIYHRQVSLLIQTLPFVATEPHFALKGGTAINLFIRDMPRLSVDIDLTYLPVEDRHISLQGIDTALNRIADQITNEMPGCSVHRGQLHREAIVNKLNVQAQGVQIKIEVTPVLRGCVYAPNDLSVSPAVEDTFGYARTKVASFADLYAGKLVAALDRQHPRDLFDIYTLFANEGVDDRLRAAFIVYLISHNRPIAEMLAPTRQDISAEFRSGFVGMTKTPVSLDELLATREALIDELIAKMPEAHQQFLISFESGEPDWTSLDIAIAPRLPAVRWRLENLAKLTSDRRSGLVKALAAVWAS